MTIAECSNRFYNALETLGDEINRILDELCPQIEQWQRDRLYHGFYTNGEPIVPTYTDFTISIKASKGQETDRVTLLDTGAFYAGIFANVEGDEILIDSTDSKSTKLKRKYGEDIFGLLPEEVAESNEITADAMVKYVKNYVGL